MNKDIELLAPAGDLESLKCAINHGANAIYLGLSKFNARAKSQSFNTENIKEIVRFAHLFSVKIYITINTLIKNSEIKEFLELVKSAVEANVDAFIIQDFGMAKLLKECFPNIVLHASTQMGIHNLYGALICEKVGFKRIVVSRETKLQDIIEIKKNTNLEIEYFVQGALCVAFSGNCYLSSLLHGNSGNRGKCLQLCRLPYKAYCGNDFIEENYLLSPADLCLIKNIKTLVESGVCSFKIEGRMKRPAYVSQTVKSYRKALDSIEKKFNYDKEIENLYKVFNRGNFNFSAYLNLEENQTKKVCYAPEYLINKFNQNHKGIFIGKTKIESDKFLDKKALKKYIITSSHNLKSGDGIKLFYNSNEIASMGIGAIKEISKNTFELITKTDIDKKYYTKQLDTYLILDKEFEENLVKFNKKLKIKCKITAKIDENLKISLNYQNISLNEISSYICPKAINKPTLVDEIKTQISKTNDTYFEIVDFEFDTQNVFIPKSILNDLRREALKNLEDLIIKNNSSNIVKIDEEKLLNFENLVAKNKCKNPYNIIITDKVIKEKIDENYVIVFSPKFYDKKIILDFFNLSKEINKDCQFGLNLPTILNYKDKEILDEILNELSPETYLYVNNYYGLYFADRFKIITSPMMNVLNKFAISHLKKFNVENVSYSIEIDSLNIDDKSCFIYSYGHFPLMTFCHCPYKTIGSSKDNSCDKCMYKPDLSYNLNSEKFSIERYKIFSCYFNLFNDRCLNLLEQHNNPKIIDITKTEKNIKDILSDKSNSNYTGVFFKEIN